MTTKEAQSLKKGDVVYCHIGNWRPNAIVDGLDVELVRTEVTKVTSGRVHTAYGSKEFGSILSEVNGLAAIAAFNTRTRQREEDACRVKAAGKRIQAFGFEPDVYFNHLKIISHGAEKAGQLADLLELAHRAMALRAKLNDTLPLVDAPVILLPLSVAQAERVLDALKPVE